MQLLSPAMLLLGALFTAAAAVTSASASTSTADGDAATTNPRSLTARVMSLSYTAPVDPTLVHSHATKMRWSSARHNPSYDPTDPSHALGEEANDVLRPTLCRTLARRLGREVFGSLAERLDGEEGRKVVGWRGEAEVLTLASASAGGTGAVSNDDGGAATLQVDLRDLEPVCSFSEGKELRYGRENGGLSSEGSAAAANAEFIESQSRHIEQTCAVHFRSLLPYYGLGFDLSFTLSEKPRDELTPEQMTQMLTPDQRTGWTEPVRTTTASIDLIVQSPNHGSGGVGLGNAPPEKMQAARRRQKLASNAERAVEKLVARADAVMNVLYSDDRVTKTTNLGTKAVQVRGMPSPPSMIKDVGASSSASAATMADGATQEEIPAHVLEICKEHGLDDARCRRAWEMMKDDMKQEEEEAAAEESTQEAESEPEPEPEQEQPKKQQQEKKKKKLPKQSDDELEAELDAWMASESEKEARAAAKLQSEANERDERERFERARRATEERERELDELLVRREAERNAEAEAMLVKIEEAERRSAAMRARAAEAVAAEVEAEAKADGDEAANHHHHDVEIPLPSPSLDETSEPPEPGGPPPPPDDDDEEAARGDNDDSEKPGQRPPDDEKVARDEL